MLCEHLARDSAVLLRRCFSRAKAGGGDSGVGFSKKPEKSNKESGKGREAGAGALQVWGPVERNGVSCMIGAECVWVDAVRVGVFFVFFFRLRLVLRGLFSLIGGRFSGVSLEQRRMSMSPVRTAGKGSSCSDSCLVSLCRVGEQTGEPCPGAIACRA